MSLPGIAQLGQAVAAHALLFLFTFFLVLKLHRVTFYSWWIVFLPLWLFHVVAARGRFSLPAPSLPHGRHWAPCHAVVAMPLLIAFELLLCVYLESISVYGDPALNLKIAFLPLLIFEVIILVDNFRMCRTLMPGDDEPMIDEAIWETLPHFWVAISMVFFVAASTFTLLKLCGDISALSWWDLFINFSIAECFCFLICTKWSNPMIHSNSSHDEGHVLPHRGADYCARMCGLQDIGGHIIKIPVITFQILLCMHLEGTPPSARQISVPALFSPLFILQGGGLLLAISRLVEKIIPLLGSESIGHSCFAFCSKTYDIFGFLQHGSRLLGWWSIDEGSKEERARLYQARVVGYDTFYTFPPEVIKKMPKKDLAEEVWRLQAALGEQAEITKLSRQDYERLQIEKVLCRVCFEAEISMVLLPCRHHVLCSSCAGKCNKCPICRVLIDERLTVYDV